MENKKIKLMGLGLAGILTITSVVALADQNVQKGNRAGNQWAMMQSGFKMQQGGFNGERKELTDEEKATMKAERLTKMKEMLDKQVADGKITQEQADEMYAKCESGDFKGMGMGERKVLTDEEKATMKAERLAKFKEMLDKQVADGKITQEQADEMYAKCESGDFKGMGMGGRQRGHCGRANLDSATATTTEV